MGGAGIQDEQEIQNVPCAYNAGPYTWSYRNCTSHTVALRYTHVNTGNIACLNTARHDVIRSMSYREYGFVSATIGTCATT